MKKIEINPGDRYGHLTIVKESEPDKNFRKFICECDCGNIRDVYMQNLRSALTQSCGCRRDKNVKKANTKHTDETLIGIKHGSWTILSSTDVLKQRVIKQIQNVIMKKVEVQCSHCGTTKKIFYNSFIYKNPATCECQKPSKNK